MAPNQVKEVWNIETSKDASLQILSKILTFGHYSVLSPVYDTVKKRAWKHIQLNEYIWYLYNAYLKENQVSDDWSIETSENT